jgi:SulP family sulfate permease
MLAAALCTKWAPRIPAPLIGVGLSALLAFVFRLHEPEVGSLHLSLPPFVGFSWTPQDVANVVPAGFGLAFAASVNVLLTSRAVEHFRGRHKPPKRTDADAELGAYGIANLCAGVFGAPMSVGIPARSVANVRCGGTTRVSNVMHALFLFLLVQLGSGALARIPLAALAGVTAWMGVCLLDTSAWRRLPKMRLVDASAFLVTAIGVLMVNAVAAVLAGCAAYGAQWAYRRYLRSASSMPEVTAGAQ